MLQEMSSGRKYHRNILIICRYENYNSEKFKIYLFVSLKASIHYSGYVTYNDKILEKKE